MSLNHTTRSQEGRSRADEPASISTFVRRTLKQGSAMDAPNVRLSSLSHGGGCGCKLAPSVLQQLLADQPAAQPYRQLLVGTETGDDAAVWQLDDDTCIIAT